MKPKDYVFVFLAVAFALMCVHSYFERPVVYWSASKNKCVKVVYDGIRSDCSQMPAIYERLWVR